MEQVLIVEDDPLFARFLRRMLEKIPCCCTLASTCADALKRAQQGGLALALLDFWLPDGNAVDLCVELRALEAMRYVPLIVVTADEDDQHLAQSFEAGAVDYLRKPPRSIELRTRVRSALRLYHAQVALAQAQRLSALGQLASAMAHEVNNPLAALQYHLRVLAASADERTAKRLHSCMQAAERIGGIVADVRRVARAEDSAVEEVSVADCVRSGMRLMSYRLSGPVQIEVELPETSAVLAHPGLLSQAVAHLLQMSLDQLEAGGGGVCRVRLSQSTLGVEASFEEFPARPVTTALAGLELCLVERTLQRFGGQMERRPAEGHAGSVTRFRLPLAEVEPTSVRL
ncbi:MAG: response regulator [Candidatus Eremiobacterota bacterium]